MTRTGPGDGASHAARAGALILAVLLGTTGCSRPGDTVAPRDPAGTAPSPGAAPTRLDKPDTLFDGWQESVDRRLIGLADQNMGAFKKYLTGEATSAVGTAYVARKEERSPELGVHRPDDSRFVLLSGVSGTVPAPEAILDAVFAGLTAVTDVVPVQPGPLGGVARCGTGKNKAIRVDVCAWAGPQTIGMIHFTGFARSDQPDQMFRQIRSQMEHPAR
ncbi:hypothetical protein [Micromonospora okii]|uniref:hypothetical protein n=1 Tax=Micromonospora okii TaxID=1182970 RepID=UPI001E349790|nr:hypothetical protein [Micromonospora okii]